MNSSNKEALAKSTDRSIRVPSAVFGYSIIMEGQRASMSSVSVAFLVVVPRAEVHHKGIRVQRLNTYATVWALDISASTAFGSNLTELIVLSPFLRDHGSEIHWIDKGIASRCGFLTK